MSKDDGGYDMVCLLIFILSGGKDDEWAKVIKVGIKGDQIIYSV